MPEADERATKDIGEDVPAPVLGAFLKRSGAYDWGMTNRPARIFRPESGRMVMLAIDHGYFQDPTSGLERPDLNVVPIAPDADALMLARHCACARRFRRHQGGVAMRASGGPSMPRELSDERIAVDIEDAARMNVHAVAVGGEHETQSVATRTTLVDAGYRLGIPSSPSRPSARSSRATPATSASDADLRRARGVDRQDLLLRGGLRACHRRRPDADRDGRREEAARARRARDGLPSGVRGAARVDMGGNVRARDPLR